MPIALVDIVYCVLTNSPSECYFKSACPPIPAPAPLPPPQSRVLCTHFSELAPSSMMDMRPMRSQSSPHFWRTCARGATQGGPARSRESVPRSDGYALLLQLIPLETAVASQTLILTSLLAPSARRQQA